MDQSQPTNRNPRIKFVFNLQMISRAQTKMEGEAGGASGTPEPHTTEEDLPIKTTENQIDSKETKTDLECRAPVDRDDILRALEVVERDSTAIAQSFASLFSSLRLALSQASSTSVEHMQCFSDIAGCLQESVLDAANKGNRYINSCLRLNEELKGMESLAMQLKFLKRNVDALDLAVNRVVKFS